LFNFGAGIFPEFDEGGFDGDGPAMYHFRHLDREHGAGDALKLTYGVDALGRQVVNSVQGVQVLKHGVTEKSIGGDLEIVEVKQGPRKKIGVYNSKYEDAQDDQLTRFYQDCLVTCNKRLVVREGAVEWNVRHKTCTFGLGVSGGD